MKVIYIKGTHDYSALEFEKASSPTLEIWNKLNAGEDLVDNDGFAIEDEALEFETVDPKFIEFINEHFMDYDSCKQSNYYVVEEQKE
jgi:hypothetical protein